MTANRWPAWCATCGGPVPAGDGQLVRVDSRWLVRHGSACPAYRLVVLPDGYTRGERDGSGCDGTWARWCLAFSLDGRTATARDRFRRPFAAARTSGKRAPAWFDRTLAYVQAAGLTRAYQMADAAEWFRTHRVGTPDGVAAAAK